MIGTLRERVTIQRPMETRDPIGQVIQDWADVGTVPASVAPAAASEIYAMYQVGMVVTHTVTIRYRADVLASAGKWRVVHGSQVYQIAGVRDAGDSRRRFLTLTCTAVL